MSYVIKQHGVPVRFVPGWVEVATHKGYTIEPAPQPDPPTEEEAAAHVAARRGNAILARLSELDAKWPRGTEDAFSALGGDESALPAAARAILAEKRALRAELAGLGS